MLYYQTVDKNDLAGKARRLKTDSSNLLDRAQKAQKKLEGTESLKISNWVTEKSFARFWYCFSWLHFSEVILLFQFLTKSH